MGTLFLIMVMIYLVTVMMRNTCEVRNTDMLNNAEKAVLLTNNTFLYDAHLLTELLFNKYVNKQGLSCAMLITRFD